MKKPFNNHRDINVETIEITEVKGEILTLYQIETETVVEKRMDDYLYKF